MRPTDTKPSFGKPPTEVPMPDDPNPSPPPSESPQPSDPGPGPGAPEVPQPPDLPEDPQTDPFEQGCFVGLSPLFFGTSTVMP